MNFFFNDLFGTGYDRLATLNCGIRFRPGFKDPAHSTKQTFLTLHLVYATTFSLVQRYNRGGKSLRHIAMVYYCWISTNRVPANMAAVSIFSQMSRDRIIGERQTRWVVKRLRLAKQQLCACCTLFRPLHISLPSQQDYDVSCRISSFIDHVYIWISLSLF